MANDALWLRCCYCGAGHRLTKYIPSADLGALTTTGEALTAWLTTHLNERQEAAWHLGQDLEGMPGLEVVTDDPSTSSGPLYLGGTDTPLWDVPFPPTPAATLRRVHDGPGS